MRILCKLVCPAIEFNPVGRGPMCELGATWIVLQSNPVGRGGCELGANRFSCIFSDPGSVGRRRVRIGCEMGANWFSPQLVRIGLSANLTLWVGAGGN